MKQITFQIEVLVVFFVVVVVGMQQNAAVQILLRYSDDADIETTQLQKLRGLNPEHIPRTAVSIRDWGLYLYANNGEREVKL